MRGDFRSPFCPSPIQVLLGQRVAGAVLRVELAVPLAVRLDQAILLDQQGAVDELLVVPDHHVPFELPGEKSQDHFMKDVR